MKLEEKSILYNYFDQVYLVNLVHHRDKRIKTFHALKSHGINPIIFQAVNGYQSPNIDEFNEYKKEEIGASNYEEINELEQKIGRKLIESPGAWGYLKTYISILNDAKSRNFSKILILEDDVILCDNFEQKFSNFINRIDSAWQLIQLGASQYDWSYVNLEAAEKDLFYLPKSIASCGSFAMGINMQIADEFIGHLMQMHAPLDNIPIGKIYDRYQNKCFIAYPNIVIPDVTESSIRPGRNQIAHSAKMKWNLDDFHFPLPKPEVTLIFQEYEQIKSVDFGGFSSFQIKWIYYVNGLLRPVHDKDSPTLRIQPADFRIDASSAERIVSNTNSEFVVLLKRDVEYTTQRINEFLEEFILKDIKNDDYNVLSNEKNLFFSKKLTKTPKVAIVIPTFKRAQHLENAIDSVLNQSYKNIEIIVVDDNEPDSEFRMDSLHRKDNYHDTRNIRFIFNELKLNGAASRNAGLFNTKAELIGFLDDDDIYFPNKIEDCVNALRRVDDSFGAVYGGFIGGNSASIDFNRYKSGDLTKDLLELNYRNHYLNTDTVLYRREALLKINGFDDSFVRHQDIELNLRFFEFYKISALEVLVAKIRPIPTETDNLLSGESLFDLKIKFLSKFKQLITSFSIDEQLNIYTKHWEEVRRYYKDDQKFFARCGSYDAIGLGHYLLGKNALQDLAIKNQVLEGKLTTLNGELEKKSIELNNLKDENRKIIAELTELNRQKEWYEMTYERLPLWWKYASALIRKTLNIKS